MQLLENQLNQGHQLIIISASIENWIIPWAEKRNIAVLATQIVSDASGRLTGKFKSANCYGIEKVNRLLAVLPDRQSYYLYAYGDSKGDQALIDFADEGFLVTF
jgi:HAD superfamily phosphoserine phosphatase-like hydrolase